ncbi:conserved hypothetical protein [Candidatus Desulfarcum epimagneticum]|uniref:Nucleoside phosphorylase domain-containing protein n=1 Tax=uncultured Desulfobacteraceae bacterium TaxID=218296 RepID=A0A484HHK1_9BACT|nr:conserved hypothetical protein [uncultured Desulfobacteraceae bacterium]
MAKPHVITLEMAVMSEAKPFALKMGLEQTGDRPFRVFENETTALIISGVGKARAAMAALWAIREWGADEIINMGSAGANDALSPLGAVFQINRICESDRMDLHTRKPVVHIPETFPDLDSASLSTMDVPAIDAKTRRDISRMAALSDMEGAAVAQACRLAGKKCRLFKVVTDTPAHDHEDDITQNIKVFRDRLYDFFVEKVLKRLHQKT